MRQLLYHDQKIATHIHQTLSRLYLGAGVSRQRTLVLGTIATISWLVVMVNLPPLPKCRHIYTHLGMIAAAACISTTTQKNFNKALIAQKESLSLIKKLRTTTTSEDLHSIQLKTKKLSRKYSRYLENYPPRIKD